MQKHKKTARLILDTHLWNPSKAGIILMHYFHNGNSIESSYRSHILAALNRIKCARDATDNPTFEANGENKR